MRATLLLGSALLMAGFILALQSEPSVRPGFGAVQGQVVDAQTAKPIAQAKVMAEPDDAGSGRLPVSILSDDQGNFFLNDLSPGKYVIPGAKEEEGYPDTDNAAFVGELAVLPRVLVSNGEVTRGVLVRIEKGGKVLGTINDSLTRQPILTARIRLTRADRPEWWLSSGPDVNGHFQFVMPCRPFRMEVSAPGYRTWNYDGDGSRTLVPQPESRENLVILLEKR